VSVFLGTRSCSGGQKPYFDTLARKAQSSRLGADRVENRKPPAGGAVGHVINHGRMEAAWLIMGHVPFSDAGPGGGRHQWSNDDPAA
jgi:hypothetical protein